MRHTSPDLFGHPREPVFPVRHRNVGALLLLRHARAARARYMVHYLFLPGTRRKRSSATGFSNPRLKACSARSASSRSPRRSMASTPALVYFTPILGGLLADRVLGQRRTVIIGAILMAIGHFMMAFENLMLIACSCPHSPAMARSSRTFPRRSAALYAPRRSAARSRLLDFLCRGQSPVRSSRRSFAARSR